MKPLPPPADQQPLLDKRKRVKGLAQVPAPEDASLPPLPRTGQRKSLARLHVEQVTKEAQERMQRDRRLLEKALARKVKADRALRGEPKPEPEKPKRPVQYIHFVSGGRCPPK